ncbi:alkaline serine protease, partial [Candidatus Thiomargarita nelsonii]
FDVNFLPEGALSGFQQSLQRQDIKNVQKSILQQVGSNTIKVNAQYKYSPSLALEVDEEGLSRLLNNPQVKSIEADKLVAPIMQSSNGVIDSYEAWDTGYTGEGWTVAILDTGVDKTHPFFSTYNKVVSEACYSTNYSYYPSISVCPGGVEATTAEGSGIDCVDAAAGYSSAQEDCKHGTHVAGTAAGNDDSGPHFG